MVWVSAIVQGILLGGLYALFATGLSLAFGVLRFVNLAHGDLAILAAYLTLSTSSTLGVSAWVSMVLVVAVMAAVGYIAQRCIFNFTIGPDPLPAILVTFGIVSVGTWAYFRFRPARAGGDRPGEVAEA